MPAPAVAPEKFVEKFADDPHVAAMDRQTDALAMLAGEIAAARQDFREELEKVRADFKPAADALSGLGEAQAKLCAFIIKHRLKLALSVPGVLVAVGAISPTAAEAVANIMKALGAVTP